MQRGWLPLASLLLSITASLHGDDGVERTAGPADAIPDAARIERLEDEILRLRHEVQSIWSRETASDAPRPWIDEPSAAAVREPEYPTLRWSGFLQLDSGWITQDDVNTATVGSISSQTGLRRVRLRASGDVRANTSYVVDLDFAASGHPSFRDVALAVHDVPALQNVRLGYFKQPFGMDGETSGQELLLLERQSPFAFAPFRQTGVSTYGQFDDDVGTYAVSAFVFPTDSFGVNTGDSGGWSMATRTTVLPVEFRDDCLVHLGAGYVVGNPSDNTVRYAIQPSFFVTDPDDFSSSSVPTFVDTGPIRANVFHLFNFELAYLNGPFRVQSELRYAVVDRRGGSMVGFGGGYVQLGYVLTGETPDYDRRRGIFHRVLPDREIGRGRGWGAVEATFGWAYIDLNDDDIRGGQMHTPTIGANWYVNEHAKFVFNVIPVLLTDPVLGDSNAVVFAGRAQVSF